MISVQQLNSAKKEVVEVNFDKWQLGKTLSWIDCNRPTQKDFELISKKTGIKALELMESIDINKRPHIISYKNYSFIIFRGLYEVNGKYNTAPVAVFIFKKDVITIHDKPIKGLDDLRKLRKEQIIEIFKLGAPYFIYRFMDFVVSDFFELIGNIEDSISKIEDQVIIQPKQLIVKNIFIQKRKMIYVNKALIANREVISSLEKGYLKEFKEDDLKLLRDLYYDIAQLIDLISTYRDILTSILDTYLSSVSNSLNKVVKTLTVISAFVMIPTLIASIYGMNFQKVSSLNMPELYWAYGYPFALGIMVASIVAMYIWFRKMEWL